MPTTKELLIEELLCQHNCTPAQKDIILVVRDQYNYVKKCVETVLDNTKDFTLYVWDNGSRPETADYLTDLPNYYKNIKVRRSEENLGFILPNNILAAETTAPYLILLNSDTEVGEGWSEALVGYLQAHEDVAAVGYEGGMLSRKGMGVLPWKGPEVDYVMGWCMAVPRKAYLDLGLFDQENLEFAYCEDADYCLRARERGWTVYALNVTFVRHFGNVTTKTVGRERNLRTNFVRNHEYLRKRHSKYLATARTLLRYQDVEHAIDADGSTPERVAEILGK